MEKLWLWFMVIVAAVSLVTALSFLMAFPFMWLWNYEATFFQIRTIDLPHAWGLAWLCALMFSNGGGSK